MGILYRIALVLVIIGAINWGLIGFFKFDLVASIFGGQTSLLSRIIYALVGLGGLVSIGVLFKNLDDEQVDSGETSDARTYGNLNYQTEFAEEEDFTDVQESPKKSSNKKK